jgi:integrase
MDKLIPKPDSFVTQYDSKSADYVNAATSDNTRKAYQSDIRHFIGWGGLLPADAETLQRYLVAHADRLNPRTLLRRLTAIKQWHVYQGFPDPTGHPLLRKTLTGIKNVHGKPADKAPPMTIEALTKMVRYLKVSGEAIDIRNNALLQIGFFGAFRRTELVGICWHHIQFHPEGIEILIPKSKTDQIGEGQHCAIPYGNDVLCSVKALKAWRACSPFDVGPVFSRLPFDTESVAIDASHVNYIIKMVAADAGLPNAYAYSSHSLRRGFATEASKSGAPFGAIMRQGRWRHEGTVLGYIEEGKRFVGSAVDVILSKS